MSKDTTYIREPFNLQDDGNRRMWLPDYFPYWFQYICEENEYAYGPILRNLERLIHQERSVVPNIYRARTLGQLKYGIRIWLRRMFYLRRNRLVVKDPIALFSAEWLANRFGMDVVVMIRHPAAFVSSLKRLNWTFDFHNLYNQELLMSSYLNPLSDQIRDHAAYERDIIDQAIMLWRAIYHTVSFYKSRHPEWIFVKYEDLADEPIQGYRGLYQKLGLRWDEHVQERIYEFSNEANVKEVPYNNSGPIKRDSKAAKRTWLQRLTREEIERVRVGTADVSQKFYTDADWMMDDQVM